LALERIDVGESRNVDGADKLSGIGDRTGVLGEIDDAFAERRAVKGGILRNDYDYALALAAKMAEVASYQALDVLHVHYAIPHSISAFLARELVKPRSLKIITTLHGTDITLVGNDPSFLSITRYGIEVSDGVTAVSEFLRRETVTTFGTTRDIRLIYNFVDTDLFKPVDAAQVRRRLAPDGQPLLVHISNFRPVKRVDHLVRMFERVLQDCDARLVLIGDGPERARVEKLCRELGVCGKIHFLGKQDSIVELLSAASVYLMASETESFGLSALEAMSCGVPVVAPRVGGLVELVDASSGFLVEPRDLEEMARRVVHLLTHPTEAEEMGANARRRAVERFDIHTIIPQYEQYYCEIGGDS